MPTDVRVPTTGNAGEDAVVVEWNVAEGDDVAAGDVLVILETAKSTIEVDAPTSGRVFKIHAAVGDEVPEHEVLAVIGSSDAHGQVGASSPDIGPASALDMGGTAPATPTPAVTKVPHQEHAVDQSAASSAPTQGARRSAASPRAKVLAARGGLDLTSVQGSGPGGRIVISDVQAAMSKKPALSPALTSTESGSRTGVRSAATLAVSPLEGATPSDGPSSSGLTSALTSLPASPITTPPERLPPGVASELGGLPRREHATAPVRGARRVTAQRMHASLQASAQVTLTRYATGDALSSYARRLREVTDAQGRPRIGVNDLLLFAAARTLARHPQANSWFEWDGIRQFDSVDLGFAVDTGKALLVPVIRDAALLSLGELAVEARSAIDKARTGRLSAEEMQGGTFTVSNLGGLGVHWFTPVLNPPQTCILGVGALHQPHPQAPALLPLSLTFDHRAIDGAGAAAVLADIAAALESIDVLVAL